jgi:hypothetical protein
MPRFRNPDSCPAIRRTYGQRQLMKTFAKVFDRTEGDAARAWEAHCRTIGLEARIHRRETSIGGVLVPFFVVLAKGDVIGGTA